MDRVTSVRAIATRYAARRGHTGDVAQVDQGDVLPTVA